MPDVRVTAAGLAEARGHAYCAAGDELLDFNGDLGKKEQRPCFLLGMIEKVGHAFRSRRSRRLRPSGFFVNELQHLPKPCSIESPQLPAHRARALQPSTRCVRHKYLERLCIHGRVDPSSASSQLERASGLRTLIVFDWDDTLISSTCVTRRPWTKATDPKLQALARAARGLLEFSKTLGETIIVTNATSAWVEESAKKYMPALLPTLANIPVISARELAGASRFQMDAWKFQAFDSLHAGLDPDVVLNLISIGDSMYEWDAAHETGQLRNRTVVKTLKLKGQPSHGELRIELDVVSAALRGLVERTRSEGFEICPDFSGVAPSSLPLN
mmetsp:Transcript_157744/g.505925  ORF Transcript_157744/g.505925 Transcript_157744/m.505925 type:complete len:329 (+) Transcript_157744:29-1015(+)